jgi:hypothetical protein
VETAQTLDICWAIVYPVELNQRPIAKRPQTEKRRLVHVCESIVHRVHGSSFALHGVRFAAAAGAGRDDELVPSHLAISG